MRSEELKKISNEIDRIVLKSNTYVYNLLLSPFTVDDAFAKDVNEKRKEIFDELIPLIKRVEAMELNEEEQMNFAFDSMESFPDEFTDNTEINAKIAEIEGKVDPSVVKSLEAIRDAGVLIFIFDKEQHDEEYLQLLEFIGY